MRFWRPRRKAPGSFPRYARPRQQQERLTARPLIRIEAAEPSRAKELVKEEIRRTIAQLSEKKREGTITPDESRRLAHFRSLASGVLWEMHVKREGGDVIDGLDRPLFADAKEGAVPARRRRASEQSRFEEE